MKDNIDRLSINLTHELRIDPNKIEKKNVYLITKEIHSIGCKDF